MPLSLSQEYRGKITLARRITFYLETSKVRFDIVAAMLRGIDQCLIPTTRRSILIRTRTLWNPGRLEWESNYQSVVLHMDNELMEKWNGPWIREYQTSCHCEHSLKFC